jgi:hypothetical protein
MAEFRRATDELKDEFRQLENEPPESSAQAARKDDSPLMKQADVSVASAPPATERRE